MKYRYFFAVAFLAVSSALLAQSSSSQDYIGAVPDGGTTAVAPATVSGPGTARPFSKVAFGAGISPLGIQLSLTTSLNPHVNLRATGNMFNYSTTFTASGIGANAKLDLKSAGAALDLYPFHKGFRVSPGLLFYNGNQVSATANVAAGQTFTLNDHTYYSATAQPVNGNALLSLHPTNPAFTVTTGWGNQVPGKGHWSFPFEVGVALTGAPSLKVNLGGQACYDQQQTLCTDIASKTDPIALQIQSNLTAQVAKWTKDIEPLRTYPIASFGVAYSFGGRSR